MHEGYVILMKNDLINIVFDFKLVQYLMKKIKKNLTISIAYNSIVISIVAELLYGFTNSLILTTALALLDCNRSDLTLFGNSLLLTKSMFNHTVRM
jgi:cation transport ATPase